MGHPEHEHCKEIKIFGNDLDQDQDQDHFSLNISQKDLLPLYPLSGLEGRGGQHLRVRGHCAGGGEGGQGQRAAEGGGRPAAGDDDHAAGRAAPKRRHTVGGVRRAR